MFRLVSLWEESEMSQVQFAKENGIKPTTFSYWILKSRETKEIPAKINDSSFIELTGLPESGIVIKYPNGIELCLPNHTSVDMIKNLIK